MERPTILSYFKKGASSLYFRLCILVCATSMPMLVAFFVHSVFWAYGISIVILFSLFFAYPNFAINKEIAERPMALEKIGISGLKSVMLSANKMFTIYYTGGQAKSVEKNLITRVTGTSSKVNYNKNFDPRKIVIASQTKVDSRITLKDSYGKEQLFELEGMNIASREGNQLSVLWAIKKDKQGGNYFAVYNHTTQHGFFNDKVLRKMFRWPIWKLMILVFLSLFLGRIVHPLIYAGIVIFPLLRMLDASRRARDFKKHFDFSKIPPPENKKK